ncbi:hypothetical protein HOG16_02390 [Candidatus Woesearchaeota archaeon]|jgi:hypothetical protein|nr:hypothetical protein [Candidatus Woesearchaeota archaeon]
MRISDSLQVFSQILNFTIFVYFSIELIKANFLDIIGLSISAMGLFSSIMVSIIAAIERIRGN